MKLYPHFYVAIAFIVLASCRSSEIVPKSRSDTTQTTSSQKVVIDKNFKIAVGQIIYVPVYSHIYHNNEQDIFNLTATLSIRNTDLSNPIIITSVRYYDSGGKLVKQYLERPIQLGKLASTDFVVNRTDTSGGLGANFIVEWVAQTEISEPIVEAIMISTASQQGISWSSPGRVIKRQGGRGAGGQGRKKATYEVQGMYHSQFPIPNSQFPIPHEEEGFFINHPLVSAVAHQ